MDLGPEELSQFNLFCAYHLGITRNNTYKFHSVQEVARRFNVSVEEIKHRITELGLETTVLRKLGFDAEMSQLDIKVAPEGVSRRELGRTMWAELGVEFIEPKPLGKPEGEDDEEAEAEVEAKAEGEAEASSSVADDELIADDGDVAEELDEAPAVVVEETAAA